MVVLSPEVEGKKVLGEISKGVVEPHFGVVSGIRSQVSPAQPAAGQSLPWDPGPQLWWTGLSGIGSGRREGGSGWLGRAGWGGACEPEPWD